MRTTSAKDIDRPGSHRKATALAVLLGIGFAVCKVASCVKGGVLLLFVAGLCALGLLSVGVMCISMLVKWSTGSRMGWLACGACCIGAVILLPVYLWIGGVLAAHKNTSDIRKYASIVEQIRI